MKRPHPLNPVIVVDDDELWLKSLGFLLKRKLGITNVIACSNPAEVMPMLAIRSPSLIVLDFSMPRIMGDRLLANIKEEYPDIPVILLTGADQLDIAVKCMQRGAFDYCLKSHQTTRFLTSVVRALKHHETLQENRLLNSGFLNETSASFAGFWTRSFRVLRIYRYLEAISQSSEPVLFVGESGTGKATLASSLHTIAKREGQFVVCRILDHGDFLGDVLSGHGRNDGLLAQADVGTLHLDGIEHLTKSGENYLINLLTTSQYPSGATQKLKWFTGRITVSADVPIDDLLGMKALMQIIGPHIVEVPPLRERREDIQVLLDCFLDDAARHYRKSRPVVPTELVGLLQTYDFPQNLHELRDMVFGAVLAHTSGILSLDSFRTRIAPQGSTATLDENLVQFYGHRLPTLSEVQDILLNEACRRASGNQGLMAAMLGVSRTAINKRLKSKQNSHRS